MTLVLVDVDGVINAIQGGDMEHWPADSWLSRTVHFPGTGLTGTLTWSKAVIDGLRIVEQTPGVQMRWCTTWEGSAPEVLSPLVGIGANWPFEAMPAVPDGFTDWWKARAAQKALQDYDRVVWIDDDIAPWSNMLTLAGREEEWHWALSDRMWWVCPDTRLGLEPEHFEEIRRFMNGEEVHD